MSIFKRKPLRVKHTVELEPRIAPYTIPLIDRLATNDREGDTYRISLREWRYAERPVIDTIRGSTSWLRIDGPMQEVDEKFFPLGSLLQSPGVIAHLDPIETRRLERRIRTAVENAILAWIAEFDLQSLPPVSSEVNRATADPIAIQKVIEWLATDDHQEYYKWG